MDWLAAMKRRFRFGPPKVRLAHTSGSRIRPSSLPAGLQTVTPLYPSARPALLDTQRLPSTSQRRPSGPHFTPSIMQSEKSFRFDTLLSLPTSNEYTSLFPPAPVSPGPLPVLAM